MKKIVMSAALGMVVFSACSQNIPVKDVPSVVLNSFNSAYNNVAGVEWEKINDLYEADFDVNKVDHAVLLNASGAIVMRKQDADERKLPAALTSAIASKFPKYKIDDAELVERNGKKYYQLELEGKGLSDQKVLMTEGGVAFKGFEFWD